MYLAGFRRLLPMLRLPPFPAVLDVGSGTGINLLEAAQWFFPTRALCGIDISPGMVEVARLKAARLGIPAQFTAGDAESLPYPDNSFDLVICNSVLHWFENRPVAIREMTRVLRPGGQLALICAAAPGFREWLTLMDQLLHAVGAAGTARTLPQLPTALEVAAMLSSAGLMIQHLANPIQVQRIRDPQTFVRQMSTVAPQWAADLHPQQQAWLEQLAAMALKRSGPLGFPNTWSAVEAVAIKPIV